MPASRLDLLQGTLDLLILRTLALGPMHGWAISQRIQQISDDVLRVNQGSLYPALHRLEDAGWIDAEWGRAREQPPGEVLPAHEAGRAAAERRAAPVGAHGRSPCARARRESVRRSSTLVRRPPNVTWTRLIRRLRALRAGQALDGQLDVELQFHLDLEAERLVRAGHVPPARRAPPRSRAFGGVERVSEECRDARGPARGLDALCGTSARRHARSGASRVRRCAAILHARPRHRRQHRDVQRHPRRAAEAAAVRGRRSARAASGSRRRSPVRTTSASRFASSTTTANSSRTSAGWWSSTRCRSTCSNRGEPDRVDTGVVSANFFDVLGVRPILGRTFVDGRRRPRRRGRAGPEPRLLAHAVWRRPAHRRPRFQMNDRPHTVVGVLPPFRSTRATATCTCRRRPARSARAARSGSPRTGARSAALQVFGRLKPGVPHAACRRIGGARGQSGSGAITRRSTAHGQGSRPRPWACCRS